MTSIYNICKIARGYWKRAPISTHCTAMLGGPMVPGRNQLIEFPIVEKSRILKTIQFQLWDHLPPRRSSRVCRPGINTKKYVFVKLIPN